MIAEAVLQGAERIRGDRERAEAAVQFHRELFIDKAPPKDVNARLLESGEDAAMLAAIVYIGALPQMIAFYKAKRIPEQVLVDTLGDMAIWMTHHREMHGEWGLGQLGWLIQHCTCKLFRLGRLQFCWMTYTRPFKAFRDRNTGAIAVLSESGVRYRADGQADGTNGVYDPEHSWVSDYRYDAEGRRHIGQPCSPEGAALRRTVALREEQWELVLQQGDPVLDVHIPTGGKMTHELCRASYGEALAFVERYFPEKPFRAFVCSSWLLAPQFQSLLPADSNIVRFQSDYVVTPIRSDEKQTLERVFGFHTKLEDLPRLPRESSLQRILHDYLSAGGAVHGAAGFILQEDWSRGTARASEALLAAADAAD
jgi:hypothetical protein